MSDPVLTTLLWSGHLAAGEDCEHDGGGVGARHWSRLCPLLSSRKLTLEEFNAIIIEVVIRA